MLMVVVWHPLILLSTYKVIKWNMWRSVTKCDEGVTNSKSSSHPKVAIFQLVNPKTWRTPTFLKKLFFGKMNGTSSLFLVFPHLVLLNSTQADGHRTEAHPNDVFRSAIAKWLVGHPGLPPCMTTMVPPLHPLEETLRCRQCYLPMMA